MKALLALVLAVLIFAALFSMPVMAQTAALTYTYTVTDLGTLGGTQAWANSINNGGQVVGWACDTGGVKHAFLWTPEGIDGVPSNPQMKDLGLIVSGQNSPETRAHSINNLGHVVGTASIINGPSPIAFFWAAGDSQLTGLGIDGGLSLAPYDINDSNQIVGYAGNSNPYSALLWQWPNGPTINLNTIPNAICNQARTINNVGQVAGRYYGSEGPRASHAVMWRSPSIDPAQVLYFQEPTGCVTSIAYSINDRGQAVGFVGDASFDYFGVWNSDGTLNFYGRLDNWCLPTSINNLGEVVGFAVTARSSRNRSYRPVRWTEAVGFEDMVSCIDGSNPFTTLDKPTAINDNGIIVGTTKYEEDQGDARAFMLTPIKPVPGSSPADLNSLSATTPSKGSVTLTWAYTGTPNPTRFRIDRKGSDGRWIKVVTTLNGSARGYTMTKLSSGMLYYFRVRAENVSGSSVYISNFAVASVMPR